MSKGKKIGIVFVFLAIVVLSSLAIAAKETNNGGIGRWNVLERTVA